jgi:hypothetical protein
VPTSPDRDRPSLSRCVRRPDLPDPLETLAGDPVETPAAWRERRREVTRLFRRYVYGFAPGPPTLDVEERAATPVFDGAGSLREVTLRFADLPAGAPTVTLLVVVPSGADPTPVVFGLNREGNHATVASEAVTRTESGDRFGADRRGARADAWCVRRLVERGYGFATYHCGAIDPDRNDFTDGIHPHYDDGSLPGPVGSEWGTLAAWAWGLQRCVDYLASADDVIDGEIAITGHSRRGKAALLAGATDERIGLVAPHQSGTGGCALSRDNGQESVADITERFPHWFADAFAAAAGQVDRLPVDQHLLVALVAPRPLFDTEGARDYWANPGRALDALRAADPVYELLGETGLADPDPLYGDEEITPHTVGTLAQYRRETGHVHDRGYWDALLDFADVHFEGAG